MTPETRWDATGQFYSNKRTIEDKEVSFPCGDGGLMSGS